MKDNIVLDTVMYCLSIGGLTIGTITKDDITWSLGIILSLLAIWSYIKRDFIKKGKKE